MISILKVVAILYAAGSVWTLALAIVETLASARKNRSKDTSSDKDFSFYVIDVLAFSAIVIAVSLAWPLAFLPARTHAQRKL